MNNFNPPAQAAPQMQQLPSNGSGNQISLSEMLVFESPLGDSNSAKATAMATDAAADSSAPVEQPAVAPALPTSAPPVALPSVPAEVAGAGGA